MNRKTRHIWSAQSEQLLINLWTAKHRQLKNVKRNYHIRDEMSKELRKRGYLFTAEDIKTKMHNIATRYRKERAKNRGSSSVSDWHWYSQIHKLIGSTNGSLNNDLRVEVDESIIADDLDGDGVKSDPLSPTYIELPRPRIVAVSSLATEFVDSDAEAEAAEASSISTSSPPRDVADPLPSRKPLAVTEKREAARRKVNFQQQILSHLANIETEFNNINSDLEKANMEFKERSEQLVNIEIKKSEMLETYVNEMSQLKDAFISFLNRQR